MAATQIPSKAPSIHTPGWTAEIDYCAGGSFAQIIVRDGLGVKAWSKVREPFEAVRLFEKYRAE